jgi:gamma-glutamyltranspeptidase/glutathione hydrolase
LAAAAISSIDVWLTGLAELEQLQPLHSEWVTRVIKQKGHMQLRAHHHYPSRRSAVAADNVVSTSQPLAAQAGLSMLARGGNAVDAAIAAAITLTVVEPSGNGIGSDAFAIVWDGKELHGLNASGRSPAGWTPERFAGKDAMPDLGWESVTVPGAVSAWVKLSDRFGKLEFTSLFEPAIRYAQSGFPVSPVIATLWQRAAGLLGDQPGFAETFLPARPRAQGLASTSAARDTPAPCAS